MQTGPPPSTLKMSEEPTFFLVQNVAQCSETNEKSVRFQQSSNEPQQRVKARSAKNLLKKINSTLNDDVSLQKIALH